MLKQIVHHMKPLTSFTSFSIALSLGMNIVLVSLVDYFLLVIDRSLCGLLYISQQTEEAAIPFYR